MKLKTLKIEISFLNWYNYLIKIYILIIRGSAKLRFPLKLCDTQSISIHNFFLCWSIKSSWLNLCTNLNEKKNIISLRCYAYIQEDMTKEDFEMVNLNIINCWSLRLLSSFQCCETIKMIVILKSGCLRIDCNHKDFFSKCYLIFSDIKYEFR